MGFLDLGGSLGRRFGSIGVGLEEIGTQLIAEAADELQVSGPDAERARRGAERLAVHLGRALPARITIREAIPGHAGLGSGTQMALAVGTALARLHGLDLAPAEIAAITQRGARSGIGIACFEAGGLVVDAGRGARTGVPPVIARLDFPADWHFVIVLDQADQGLHGQGETQAFATLPEFPRAAAAHLCHLLVMQGLPALLEADLVAFGDFVTALQAAVGDHFAPAQGGRFTSPRVAAALDCLAAQGGVGIGQSSWGPTGFCLAASRAEAERLCARCREQQSGEEHLRFLVGTPRRRGALVQDLAGALA